MGAERTLTAMQSGPDRVLGGGGHAGGRYPRLFVPSYLLRYESACDALPDAVWRVTSILERDGSPLGRVDAVVTEDREAIREETPAVTWHSVVPAVLGSKVRAWTEGEEPGGAWSQPIEVAVTEADIDQLPGGQEAQVWSAGDPILTWDC
jgi:hypothetical protein